MTMKKIVMKMIVSSMCMGTIYASELKKEAGHDFVVVGKNGQEEDAEDVSPDERGEQSIRASNVRDALEILTKKKLDESLESKKVFKTTKEKIGVELPESDDEAQWASAKKNCRNGLAGAIIGVYVAALVKDYYGTRGNIIFSILTSAAALATRSEENIFLKNRYLVGGFVSGVQIPLMAVFFKKRK